MALVAGVAARPQAPTPLRFDLLILNARVIDGTGAPARVGSIGVRDGRIVQVAQTAVIAGATAAQTIDAHGMVVSPGFIDVHTHADDLAEHPTAQNFLQMGVTTIVAGNCGSSALDIGAALDAIRIAGPAINFATLVGHNTIRQAVMGRENRAPTLPELAKMKALVFKAMADGAVGFSTGLQYIPGAYAQQSEIIELMHVAANEGGIYATHMRNEGTALEDAIAESIRVAELTDARLEISHLKVDSPKRWGAASAALRLIDDARARGVDVQADQYAYTAGSSSLSIRFPAWALEGSAAEVRARLNDPASWARIKQEMRELLDARGFADLSWAAIASDPADPSLNGLTMKEAAQRVEGASGLDAQLELARVMQAAGGASMVYHFMSDADVAAIMRHPMVAVASDASIITFGDGVPHPRGYGDNARVLATFVRERHVLPLEEAIRKMTSLPAAHFRFAHRGVIAPGAFADLVMFDPAAITDRATYAQPHAYPSGIALVIVNGAITVRDGKLTGARAGQIVTRDPS